MSSNKYLAVDLGASSGRVIVECDNQLEEIHRFGPYLKVDGDAYTWDIEYIYNNILEGIKKALMKHKDIKSMAIDAWGVDYVLLNGDKPIYPVYSYRYSKRCDAGVEATHKLIPFDKLYSITGIQFANFNTIYQLKWDLDNGRLANATDFLHIPEYLSYLLTGKKAKEYTMASTTGLLDLKTNSYSQEILSQLNLPQHLFPKLVQPGYVLGDFKPEIKNIVGGNIPVIMTASHDTGAAFEAIDFDEHTVFISSGTWSLVGVKIPKGNNSLQSLKCNFTNEGGIGYIRYLKNIMGQWIFNEVRKNTNYSYDEIDEMILKSSYDDIFNVNDKSLLSPKDMKAAVLALLPNKPNSDADLFRSIYRSLAVLYKQTADELETNLGNRYTKIMIVGGGCKSPSYNKLVAELTGRELIAQPIEATALGNIKVQKGVK